MRLLQKNMRVEKSTNLPEEDTEKAVQILVEGMRIFNKSPLLKHAKRRSLSSNKNNFIVIRSESNELEGFLMYRLEKDTCIVYEIHVKEEKRGMGYGTILVNELFKDQKGKKVILFVYKKNSKAQKFYLSKGFQFEESYRHDTYFEMFKQL